MKDTEKTPAEDTMAFLCARAYAYDFLKCTFLQEPTRRYLQLLIDGEMVQAFPFSEQDTDLGIAINTIRDYLKESDVMSEQGFQKLRWDYTRMFIGPGKVPAPPWESIYRDPARLYFSKETFEVKDAYRKYNLSSRHFGRDPDDHIGLELDFMHQLSVMAIDQAEQDDNMALLEILQDQKIFLDDHLLKWVPVWSKDVAEHAETDFYREAARLLNAYLELDRKMIEAFLAVPSTI